jgi:mycothiol system anti-sigma-R factor
MDCDQALTELEAYLDGELVEEARLVVEAHLSGCSPCFERGEFRVRLRAIVRRKCTVVADLPPSVADRIRGAIASAD